MGARGGLCYARNNVKKNHNFTLFWGWWRGMGGGGRAWGGEGLRDKNNA